MGLDGPQHSGKSPQRQGANPAQGPLDDIALPPARRGGTTGRDLPPVDLPPAQAAAAPPAVRSEPAASPAAGSPPRSTGFRWFPWLLAAILLTSGALSWSMLRGYFGGDNEAELSRKRMAHFAAREAAAPQDQRDHLKKLRDQVASRKLKFTVGYTTALERDAKSITGLVVPANLEEQMRQHAALAKDDPAQTPSPAAAEQQNAEPQPSTAEAKSATEEPAAAEKPKAGEPAVAADKQPSFDWRKQGLVTAVRDQATCASCWAFATVGAFESSWLRQNSSSSSVDMSEQQVVDCSGLGSCNGGWLAFDYLMDHGIGSEQAYPYQAQDMPPESTSPREFRASSWGFVSANPLYEIPSVQRIKKALVEHGPLAVCVRTNDLFRGYTGGVYDDDDPGPTDHALMIIGWDDEKQAWLLKNSWGSEWGEECGYGNERGYMWIAYGSNRIGERAAWVDAQSQ